MVEAWTDDRLLGGRVRLRQPARGFRASIDAVLMAAAVPAVAGETALELGCGTGAAALCLAARVGGLRIVGLEVDADVARLAAANAAVNAVADRMTVVTGDVRSPVRDREPAIAPAAFDHVMANPPHLLRERARASPDPARAAAMVEGEASLQDWLAACGTLTRPRGSLTVIHRADRLDAVLAALGGAWGDVGIVPLWPGPNGRAAKRVIVTARKGAKGRLRLLPGLVLHEPDGRYTDAAQAVLRDGAPLATAALA